MGAQEISILFFWEEELETQRFDVETERQREKYTHAHREVDKEAAID